MDLIEELEVKPPPAKFGAPTWPVALLFPNHGHWTEDDYFALDTNRLVELSDGCLEVLPMATLLHQLVVKFLFLALDAHVTAHQLGTVLFAPLPIRLWPGKIREPDVVFLRPNRVSNLTLPPNGADFVIEVLSPGQDNHERDLNEKRLEYAKAAIGEYWVVDAEAKRITAFVLEGDQYKISGEFAPGQTVASVVLPGFQVDVAAVFAAAEGNAPTVKNGT